MLRAQELLAKTPVLHRELGWVNAIRCTFSKRLAYLHVVPSLSGRVVLHREGVVFRLVFDEWAGVTRAGHDASIMEKVKLLVEVCVGFKIVVCQGFVFLGHWDGVLKVECVVS